MNWYMQSGRDSDVIISTKITFSRNLRNYKFETQNQKEIQEIENLIKSKLAEIGYNLKFVKLKDIDNLEREEFVEKGLITEEVAKNQNSSILINEEENICILINVQDHFEIQVFNSGMEIESTFNLAQELEQKIENTFDIAKNEKYGYITTSPINLGTGLKCELTIHLPALSKTGNIRKITQMINSFGLIITGKYISNQKVIGEIYQISNKQTLGITEENIIKNIKAITETIIMQERQARKLLGKNNIELEDIVYRSYGLLTNSRKLNYEETLQLMSNIKLGVDLGIIKELNDKQILTIYYYIQVATLQKYFNQNLDAYDREIKRAAIIKQLIK